MAEDVIELHVIVRGEVQGVCFRAAARDHALALKLVGTVRNCSDGSVELVAQGLRRHLDSLLDSIKREPGYGRVDSLETTYRPVTHSLDGFHVLRSS
jgi:acylphosphatase